MSQTWNRSVYYKTQNTSKRWYNHKIGYAHNLLSTTLIFVWKYLSEKKAPRWCGLRRVKVVSELCVLFGTTCISVNFNLGLTLEETKNFFSRDPMSELKQLNPLDPISLRLNYRKNQLEFRRYGQNWKKKELYEI